MKRVCSFRHASLGCLDVYIFPILNLNNHARENCFYKLLKRSARHVFWRLSSATTIQSIVQFNQGMNQPHLPLSQVLESRASVIMKPLIHWKTGRLEPITSRVNTATDLAQPKKGKIEEGPWFCERIPVYWSRIPAKPTWNGKCYVKMKITRNKRQSCGYVCKDQQSIDQCWSLWYSRHWNLPRNHDRFGVFPPINALRWLTAC